MTVYKAIVSKEFIKHRDNIINKRNAGIRGADAEFVEHHQVIVDKFQTLYEGATYDTHHQILGRIDYKQYAEAGVKISPWIESKILANEIDVLGIWKWYPKNQWVKLEEGMSVQYEILDFVDAKMAASRLFDYYNEKEKKMERRFKYPFE